MQVLVVEMAIGDENRFLFDVLSAVLLLLTALLGEYLAFLCFAAEDNGYCRATGTKDCCLISGAYIPRYLAFKDDSHVPGNLNSVAFHLGNMLSAGGVLGSASQLLCPAGRQCGHVCDCDQTSVVRVCAVAVC